MSYALSGPLQAAVYDRLSQDGAIAALAPGAVYDAVPEGALPDLFLTLGPEEVRDRSDADGRGAEHRLTLSVQTRKAGFAPAKALAAAACDALLASPLGLSRGRVVALNFERATARRQRGWRQIDLRFHVRVEDDPS